jgi:hypothetical protein
MARIITKELALRIAEKLGARQTSKKNRAHDDYVVYFNGQIVARFGIRRGSEKDKGHDHVPGAIHLGPRDAKLFGQCDITYDAWVETMRVKGIIPREPNEGS